MSDENDLNGINERLAAIEERFEHLQWMGACLFVGILGSYAAVLAVALK
jgi:hypothetical protein